MNLDELRRLFGVTSLPDAIKKVSGKPTIRLTMPPQSENPIPPGLPGDPDIAVERAHLEIERRAQDAVELVHDAVNNHDLLRNAKWAVAGGLGILSLFGGAFAIRSMFSKPAMMYPYPPQHFPMFPSTGRRRRRRFGSRRKLSWDQDLYPDDRE